MTSQTKARVRNWIIMISALLPALGWGWAVVNGHFVHQDVYDKHVAIDSLKRINDSAFKALLLTKVDSTNQRLQQMVCGKRINEGCR